MNAKKRLIVRKLGLIYFLISIFLFSVPVYAAIIPCGPRPGPLAPGENISGCTLKDFFQLLVNIYNFLLGMAAIVAILILVWGGIQMFIYHYQESPEEKLSSAKLTITRAIFGLVIIAAAYLIVNTLLLLLGVQNPQNYFGGAFFG